MSGTSLDGIDVALLRTDGEDVVDRGPAATYPYRPDQQAVLHDVLQQAKSLEDREARPGILAEAEAAFEAALARDEASVAALVSVAEVKRRRGQWRSAEPLLKRAARLSPR